MVTSSLVTTWLNYSQAKSSLSRRVIGAVLEGLDTKTSRRSVSSRFGCGGRVVKTHNRAGLCWRVNLLLFVASMARKVPSIHSLGHCFLPFQRSMRDNLHYGWNWRMRLVNLHLDLVPSNTFPFVLLHGCHSKKKGGEGRKEVVQYLDDLNIKNKK